MSYLEPNEFVKKMVDAGEEKVYMSTKDTLIRAIMAGAILALAAVFAITVAMKAGSPLLGAVLFPVGFIMLYLMKFDVAARERRRALSAWPGGRSRCLPG